MKISRWTGWLAATIPIMVGLALALRAAPATSGLVLYLELWMGPLLLAALAVGCMALMAVWRRRRAELDRRHQADVVLLRAEAAERFDRFVRRLDHEVKNPLTVIDLSLAEIGGRQVDGSTEPVIRGQVEQMRTMVRALRQVSDLRHQELELETTDVGQVLEDVRATLDEQGALRGRHMTVQVQSVPARPASIQCDPDLIFLAVYNLVRNAAKYSADGADIRLSCETSRAAGGVTVLVADNGIGIPAADQAEVWEELARASNSADQPGSGIGLALVKEIISRHGGSVSLDSVEGQGTRVHVDLPAVPPAPHRHVTGLSNELNTVVKPAP